MTCPDENALAALVDGRVAADRRAELETHLDGCEACRTVAAAMLGSGSLGAAPPAQLDVATLRGGRLGRFVLLETLGIGAMGAVVAAYDPDLDRRVAIKLLHSRAFGDAASRGEIRNRLLREARAMASLSHPNVVTVHEVGTVDDEAFVAMEFAEGGTLRRWLEDGPRPRAEVLARFVAAAAGLAAAHRAGLVHRDFKPENVLVNRDGAVKVADFGLVRSAGRVAPGGALDATALGASPLALDATMTHAGRVLGTPWYMAPEQHRGERVNAAANQFAFCVALWEALYGERPFAGATYAELATAVLATAITPPRSDAGVPAWLRAVLERGLRRDPDARWASMDALQAALLDDPQRARRRRVTRGAVGLALVGSLALAGLALRSARAAAEPCPSAEGRLVGVWDAAGRERVRAAFAAGGRADAGERFARTAAVLDQRGRDWVDARRDACRATHVRGEQSPALLDRRMACLDRRLGELDALVEVLAESPDDGVIERGAEAAARLPGAEACADADALAERVPPPADPATRARIAAVEAQLARVQALESAGRYPDGLALVASAAGEALALAHAPTRAEALFRWGRLRSFAGEFGKAETTLRAALLPAAASRDDALVARIWAELVTSVGVDQEKTEAGTALVPYAEAAAARIGDDTLAAAAVHDALGMLGYAAARYPEGQRSAERALAVRERLLGKDHMEVAVTLAHLGTLRNVQGDREGALALYQREREIQQQVNGPDHPEMAATLGNLGRVYKQLGRYDEARPLLERGMAIAERALGPDHPTVVRFLHHLADLETNVGQLDRARALLERALATGERTGGADNPANAHAHSLLGSLAQQQGRHAEALASHGRALALLERHSGPGHSDVAAVLDELGEAHLGAGQIEPARAAFERALAIQQKTLGTAHPDLASSYNGLGDVAYSERRYAVAAREYQRSVDVLESPDADRAQQSIPLTNLARAELQLGHVARAVELAERAAGQVDPAAGDPAMREATADLLACARAAAQAGDGQRPGCLDR